jgi:hypothetical protein
VALFVRNAALADALRVLLGRARYEVVSAVDGHIASVIVTTEADTTADGCARHVRDGLAVVVLLTSASIAVHDRYEQTGALCAEIGAPSTLLLDLIATAFRDVGPDQ